MSLNPAKPSDPETHQAHPLDEVTSGEFIYETLRTTIAIALITVCTYAACTWQG